MVKPEQLDFFSLLTNDPVCPVCNEVFKKKSSHPNQIYCSSKCYFKYYNNTEKSKKYRIKYKIKNKEKIKKQNKLYRIKNKKRIEQWKKENQNKIKETRKKYILKNKEKIKTLAIKWRKKNKIHIKEYDKKYIDKNRKKINQFNRKKYFKNINYKIRKNIRTRINKSLLYQKTIKSKNTLELLGCSWDEARKHLESQFKEGMTWENHGIRGWHIDHIIPCSSFDLSNIEEQKKCFNYKNLQPLWWHENLSKGSKIISN